MDFFGGILMSKTKKQQQQLQQSDNNRCDVNSLCKVSPMRTLKMSLRLSHSVYFFLHFGKKNIF